MKFTHAFKAFVLGACVLSFIPGCATVQKEGASKLATATSFPAPPEGYAGVYIYRSDGLDANLTKVLVNLDFANRSVYIDGQYIGDSDSGVFYYRLVKPGQHTFQTESVVSENDLTIEVNEGHNYYIEQREYPGLVANIVALKLKSAKEAQPIIRQLPLAKNADDKTKDLKNANYSEGKGSIPALK